MQLSWHDAVSLLSLPVDQGAADFDICFLFLDVFFFRIVERGFYVVVFGGRVLVIVRF